MQHVRTYTAIKFALLAAMAFLLAMTAPMLSNSAFIAKAAPTIIQDEDEEDGDDEMGGRMNFSPFMYTVIRGGEPYLRVSVEVQGVIQEGFDTSEYQAKKPLMQAAIVDMLSRLAYKKFRIGKRMDPNLVAKYFQAAVDLKLKQKGAVKLYITKIGQERL